MKTLDTTQRAPSSHGAGAAPRPSAVQVEALCGDAARRLLEGAAFGTAWDALHTACPWATAFQRRDFLTTWYGIYVSVFEPVLVTGYSSAGSLVGLFALARRRSDGALFHAATHHAEYQTWLATPECGDTFAGAAFTALRTEFPAASIVLRYLAPGSPTLWLETGSAWRGRYALEPMSRALLDTDDPERAVAPLRKKGNRSKLKRLAREGDVRFERVTDSAEFARALGEIEPLYDLRQGAVHSVLPFAQDPLKRTFHEALLRLPNFLHVTVLRAAERIVSAHVGVLGDDSVALGIFTHSAAHARHSPGKLHVLMLARLLAEEGVATLDLTPGHGWKDRFASRTDEVHTLRVHFRAWRLAAHRTRLAVDRVAKSVALAVGSSPARVRARLRRLQVFGLHGVMSAALRPHRLLFHRRATRIYSFAGATAARLDLGDAASRCAVDDLDALLRHGRRDFEFLRTAEARLAEGERAYVTPDAAGWLVGSPRETWVGGESAPRPLPAGALVLRVDPGATAGAARELLTRMMRDAATEFGARSIWIAVPQSAHALREAVEELHWEHRSDVVALRAPVRLPPRVVPTEPSRLLNTESQPGRLRTFAKLAVLHSARCLGLFALSRRMTRTHLRVLCYHGFSEHGESRLGPRLFMSHETFGRHMDRVREWGFPVLGLSQALAALEDGSLPECATVITIDDGPSTVLTLGLPHLQRNGFAATLYQTTYYTVKQTPVFRVALQYMAWRTPFPVLDLTDLLPESSESLDLTDPAAVQSGLWRLIEYGEAQLDESGRVELLREVALRLGIDFEEFLEGGLVRLLSLDELRELHGAGIDIELHTHRHRLPAEREVVLREITENRDVLASVADGPRVHLCYPSNEYYPEQFPWLRELGVASGTTCNPGLNPPGTNPLELNRILDGECVPDIELQAELCGFLEILRRLRRKRRGRE